MRLAAVPRHAVDVVECSHNRLRLVTCERIIDELGLSTGLHQSFPTKNGKMLRQGGLADPHKFLQLVDGLLTVKELAKNQQRVLFARTFRSSDADVALSCSNSTFMATPLA